MKRAVLLAFSFILFSAGIGAQTDTRPKVGIVLSGGGAKGSAHIGVLKYMDEIGIPVDYVAGTSMGSIIGGLYALGYTPTEMDDIISNLNWKFYLSDESERSQQSSFDRQIRETYLFQIPFHFSQFTHRNGKMVPDEERTLLSSLPGAVVGGSNIINFFNGLSVGYHDSISFDRLPIPFACVATNILDGSEEVLRSGRFPDAIRASMALPGIFTPVVINGHPLIDGGMVNNFPVDVCQQMGADIIIGVDVGDDVTDNLSQLKSLPQLLTQLLNIVTQPKITENREKCNILITPDITNYTTLSFTKEAIDTLISRGYNEAAKHRDQFLAIKAQLDAYSEVSHPNESLAKNISHTKFILGDICFVGTHGEEKWLLRKGNLYEGRIMSGEDIEKAIGIYYSTKAYSNITFFLTCIHKADDLHPYDVYRLTLNFESSHPHAAGLGLRYDTEESAALLFMLGLNQNKFSGLKALLKAKLSYNPEINLGTTWAIRSFGNFCLNYNYTNKSFEVLTSNRLHSYLHYYRHSGKFYFSQFHLRDWDGAIGAQLDRYSFINGSNNLSQFLQLNDSTKIDIAKFVGHLCFDNQNDGTFATKGIKASLSAQFNFYNNFLNNEAIDPRNLFSLAGEFRWNKTPGDGSITIIPQIFGRIILHNSQCPIPERTYIGGSKQNRYFDNQIPFIGINVPLSTNEYTLVTRLDIRYRIAENHFISFIGNYALSNDLILPFSPIITPQYGLLGAAVAYSFNTLIGPAMIDIHWSNAEKSIGSYFSIGYNF